MVCGAVMRYPMRCCAPKGEGWREGYWVSVLVLEWGKVDVKVNVKVKVKVQDRKDTSNRGFVSCVLARLVSLKKTNT